MARKSIVVQDTEENAEKCRCPDCPSYNECMEDNNELFFCAMGNT